MKCNYNLAQLSMRAFLFTIAMLTCIQAIRADRGHAQGLNGRISIGFQDESLSDALLRFGTTVSVQIAYDAKALNLDSYKVESKRFEDAEAGAVLAYLLKNTSITYIASDAGVVLVPKAAAAQMGRIEGRVVDSDRLPLPGAIVRIIELDRAVATDQQGKYSIAVRDGTYTVEASYLAFQTQSKGQVTVSGGEIVALDFELIPASEELGGVVVTALGIERKERNLGYSIANVKGEELTHVPQENLLTALAGKVAGLKISNTVGDINSETDVYIRGITSLNGNDAPLVVINGVPAGTPNVIADLNPDNIKEISVLKGPSAAALYGSRAGNGAILITTKSGNTGKKGLGIAFNTGFTFTRPYKYVDLQNRFTTGKRGQFDEAAYQHWYGPEEGTEAVQWNTNGEASPLTFYDENLQDYFRTGFSNINDLSISSANDKGNFHLNVAQMSAIGNFPGTELKRIGASGNFEYNLLDDLKISGSIDLINPSSNNYPVQAHDDYQYRDIYMIPPHVNINDLKDYWEVENEQQRNVTSSFSNPWFMANERIKSFERKRGFGNLRVNWEVLPNLDLMVRYAQNQVYTKNEIQDPWSTVLTRPKLLGGYSQSVSNSKEENSDFLLSYEKPHTGFSLSASIGGNLMRRRISNLSAGGDYLVIPGLFTLSNVERNNLSYSSSYLKKSIYSLYGMTSLGYKDMIFLDVTARNDWSSTLPESNRSYFYPSASLSVLASELLNMPAWVSLVKLRGGWAQVGKDTDPYQLDKLLDKGTWGDLTIYSVPAQLANTNLKPEIATSYEVGADFGFLSDRLGFDFTYYDIQNENQILSLPTPGMSGYSSAKINAGNVQNRGIEINLWAAPVATADFQWNINANFTKERSKLTELTSGMDDFQFWSNTGVKATTQVGEYIGDMYSNDILRVAEGAYKGWPLLDANGRLQTSTNPVKVGNYMNDFLVGLQTSVSYKRFSLSASFDWRQGGDFYSITMMRLARSGKIEDWNNGISSSTFQGILHANSFDNPAALADEIRNHPEKYRENNVWIGGRTEDLGGFLYDGLHNGAFFPGVRSDGNGGYIENFGETGTQYVNAYEVVEPGGGYWGLGVEDKFIYDASFVKLREIALSYTLPENIISRINLQNLSVSVFTKNILLWTAAKVNIDPEFSYLRTGSGMNQGVDRWNGAPLTMPIGFKIHAQF